MNKYILLAARIVLLALFAFHLFTLNNGDEMLLAASKSILMPALMIFYFLAQYDNDTRSMDYRILTALFFSWLGDVLLLKGHYDPDYFMYGLLAFFVAHILYAFSFYKDMRNTSQTSLLVGRPHYGLPFLIVSILFIYTLMPGLGDFSIPVVAYCGIITIMLLFAFNRWEKVPQSSFWLVFGGALLFYISDAMIAINKFYMPFENQRFMIMLTYIAGQWAIVEGILRRGR